MNANFSHRSTQTGTDKPKRWILKSVFICVYLWLGFASSASIVNFSFIDGNGEPIQDTELILTPVNPPFPGNNGGLTSAATITNYTDGSGNCTFANLQYGVFKGRLLSQPETVFGPFTCPGDTNTYTIDVLLTNLVPIPTNLSLIAATVQTNTNMLVLTTNNTILGPQLVFTLYANTNGGSGGAGGSFSGNPTNFITNGTAEATIANVGAVPGTVTYATNAGIAAAVAGTLTNNLSGNVAYATNAGTAVNLTGSFSGNVTGTQGATVVSSVGSASLPASQITGTISGGNLNSTLANIAANWTVNSGGQLTNTTVIWTNSGGFVSIGPSNYMHFHGTNGADVIIDNSGNLTLTGDVLLNDANGPLAFADFEGLQMILDGNLPQIMITNIPSQSAVVFDPNGNLIFTAPNGVWLNNNDGTGGGAGSVDWEQSAGSQFYIYPNQSGVFANFDTVSIQPGGLYAPLTNDILSAGGNSNNYCFRIKANAAITAPAINWLFTNVSLFSNYVADFADRIIIDNPSLGNTSNQITLPALGYFGGIICSNTNWFSWTTENQAQHSISGIQGTRRGPLYTTVDFWVKNVGSNTANTLSVCLADHSWFTNLGSTNILIPLQTSAHFTTDGTNVIVEFLSQAPASTNLLPLYLANLVLHASGTPTLQITTNQPNQAITSGGDSVGYFGTPTDLYQFIVITNGGQLSTNTAGYLFFTNTFAHPFQSPPVVTAGGWTNLTVTGATTLASDLSRVGPGAVSFISTTTYYVMAYGTGGSSMGADVAYGIQVSVTGQ